MSQRVLIFVVAYNAKDHIRSVLDRLPREVINHPDYHVLIIDDCSKDDTAKTAAAHATSQGYNNITILRNTINQGYGGNQKLGYRYAAQNGFGLVILLHGDGQYAPELVLEFVKRWKEEKAEVVLGSRMLKKSDARAGGMPLYKWIGNQILTGFQNLMVKSSLSEFHTGYRAYDVEFLKKIPFELNTNDFHFDTEILLQALATEAKCVEFAIPTHYGDEICHVNGMQYAWDVVKSCVKFRSQKIGFFCSMQYRGLIKTPENQPGSSQFHVPERIKKVPSKVLNISFKTGYLDKRLHEMGCTVENIDLYSGGSTLLVPEHKIATVDISNYDYVLLVDVMEKLTDCEKTLVDLRYGMSKLTAPTVVLSTWNVAFWGLRVLLGLGMFNYGEGGILKVNHKRLFTLSSLRAMLREAGYEPGSVRGIGVPFHLLFTGRFGRFLSRVSDMLARAYPSFFAYRFLIEATPKPHTYALLSSAEKFYESSPAKSAGV